MGDIDDLVSGLSGLDLNSADDFLIPDVQASCGDMESEGKHHGSMAYGHHNVDMLDTEDNNNDEVMSSDRHSTHSDDDAEEKMAFMLRNRNKMMKKKKPTMGSSQFLIDDSKQKKKYHPVISQASIDAVRALYNSSVSASERMRGRNRAKVVSEASIDSVSRHLKSAPKTRPYVASSADIRALSEMIAQSKVQRVVSEASIDSVSRHLKSAPKKTQPYVASSADIRAVNEMIAQAKVQKVVSEAKVIRASGRTRLEAQAREAFGKGLISEAKFSELMSASVSTSGSAKAPPSQASASLAMGKYVTYTPAQFSARDMFME